jgi:hypothetical protein
MRPDDVAKLKNLEKENARVKRLLAEKELVNDMLREVARGKMVTPRRRWMAVVSLQDRFGVSERRACRVLAQHRSTQRHRRTRGFDEARLRAMSLKFPAPGIAGST